MLESSVGVPATSRGSQHPQNPATDASDTPKTQGALYGPEHHVNNPTMDLDGDAPVQEEDEQQDQTSSTEASDTEVTRSPSNGHEQDGGSPTAVAGGTPSQDESNQQTQIAPVPAPAIVQTLIPSAPFIEPPEQVSAVIAAQNALNGPQQQDDNLMARSRLFNDSITDPMEWIESSMMEDNTTDVDLVVGNMVTDDGTVEISRPQTTGYSQGQRVQGSALVSDHTPLVNPYEQALLSGKYIESMIALYRESIADIIDKQVPSIDLVVPYRTMHPVRRPLPAHRSQFASRTFNSSLYNSNKRHFNRRQSTPSKHYCNRKFRSSWRCSSMR